MVRFVDRLSIGRPYCDVIGMFSDGFGKDSAGRCLPRKGLKNIHTGRAK
jgi:hypothetical protein